MDGAVLFCCLPLQKYTNSGMNVIKSVLFSVKNGVAEKHLCHSYQTVVLFCGSRKGWKGRSVDLRVAFMFIFLAFFWSEGYLCLQLGLPAAAGLTLQGRPTQAVEFVPDMLEATSHNTYIIATINDK